MTTPRFVKLDAEGNVLPADATDHAQVLDDAAGLIWTARHLNAPDCQGGQPYDECEALAKACRVGGNDDWRLPTLAELFAIADHSRRGPAIDQSVFPGTESDWYWTSTPYAGSPAEFAWIVSFSYGGALYGHRDGRGFVRAVRSVRAPSQ